MKTHCFRILLSAVLLAGTLTHAATRARSRAETIFNDASVRVSAGAFHTCQINEDGTVRCWGLNDNGQLGDGSGVNQSTPVLVSGLNGAVAVSAGFRHTCALLAEGTVRCWGANSEGQLGDGTTLSRSTPVTVAGIVNAVAISAGNLHTCAVLANGAARCWGGNRNGQLGNGNAAVTTSLTPVNVSGISTAVSIQAGALHTCAVLANGTASCWGDNSGGQIGPIPILTVFSPMAVPGLANAGPVIAIAPGSVHTCALIADGSAFCWGLNTHGQLGNGSTTGGPTQFVPPGRVLGPGSAALTGVSGIEAGPFHTCALLASGTAVCWGQNTTGQIGDTTFGGDRLTAVPVSGLANAMAISSGGGSSPLNLANAGSTCALLADGSARCWGDSTFGQLGNGGTTSTSAPAIVSGGGGSFTARAIAAGDSNTCAVRANSTVACWGSDASGQLGDGTSGVVRLSPVAVSGVGNAIAVAAGVFHTCALLADGTIRCWGDNTFGQLGSGITGGTQPFPAPVAGLSNVIAIAAGGGRSTRGGQLISSHTCALLASGFVFCWGSNESGRLGDGTTSPRPSPSAPVLLPGKAVAIAAGDAHSCAILASGLPYCWGANASGQLGVGDGSFAPHPFPAQVFGIANVVALAGGSAHTCALQVFGYAVCWGANSSGQLGHGDTSLHDVPVNVDLTKISDTLPALGLGAGIGHSCAIMFDGTARCWGDNQEGELGNNTITSSTVPVVVTVTPLLISRLTQPKPLSRTVAIAAGRRHSCTLFASGAVSCWGENAFGQIGIGSTTNQLQPVAVPSFAVNIDPKVTLDSNGRVSTVTIVAECDSGQQVEVDVTLTQSGISGQGHGAGQCAGGLARYPVTVTAAGPNPFFTGPATVSATALIRDIGFAVETQEWTRVVNLVMLMQP